MADENLAIQLGYACSRSAVPAETHQHLQAAFPGCRLLRLSFGLQNKVMVSITVDLQGSGATHCSYVPIHPTAAAAAVLQNQPIVVVREANRRSPLWDQEDLYQREGCTSLSVVSMPFYWPPRAGTLFEGQPLAIPQSTAFHPTFGALTAAGTQTTSQAEMARLSDLALRAGRYVGPHISMLLASLEGAGLLPTEAEAQEELQLGDEGDDDWLEDDGMGDLFGFDAAAAAAEDLVAALMPALGPQPEAQAAQQAQQEQQVRQAAQAAQAAKAVQHPRVQQAEDGTGTASPEPPTASDPSSAAAAADAPGPSSAAARPAGEAPAAAAGAAGAAAPTRAAAAGRTDPPGSDTTGGSSRSGSGFAGHGGMRLRRGMSPLKFSSLTFHPVQLERAFAMHHSRRQQKNDLLAAFVVLLGLLCAAALHMRAQWPAGLAALLLFAPYFFDARLYQGLREPLLGTTHLLFCLFLSSLQPLQPAASHAPALAAATCAALASTGTELASGSCGPEGLAPGGEAVLAGFGILRFVVHSCGLHYLTLAPLLLRLRTHHALPVQFASLGLALFHLPSAYEQATLGRVDTVHLMLLGLILIVFSLVALWALWAAELRMRDAWLERSRRRGAAAIDNNLESGTSHNNCSGGASPASPAAEAEQAAPAAAAAHASAAAAHASAAGEGPSTAAAAAAVAAVAAAEGAVAAAEGAAAS